MKNLIITIAAVLLTAGGSYFVFAQQESNAGTSEIEQINLMIAQARIQRQLVPLPDGGIIIVVGNKILKFDTNLNLVREAEFEVNLEQNYKEIYNMFGYVPQQKDIPK